MSIIIRTYQGATDLHRITHFLAQIPLHEFSVISLPYQISSLAVYSAQNVGLWEDETGRLVAVALLQEPFFSLFYALNSTGYETGVETQLLQWATVRGQAIADERGQAFSLNVWPLEGQTRQINLLQRHGFEPIDETKIYLARPLTDAIPKPELPSGFNLQHLRAEAEAEEAAALIAAAFNGATVTAGWRRQLMRMAHYTPELDIVATAPDSRQASFCLCWLHPNGQVGQIEPMGTHPDFWRMGLGRAVLMEGLRRMQAFGATRAVVGTSQSNYRSLQMYQSHGFSLQYKQVGFMQTFLPRS